MYIIRCICLWMILGLMACSGPVRIQKNLEVKPEIFPDYVDVTIKGGKTKCVKTY